MTTNTTADRFDLIELGAPSPERRQTIPVVSVPVEDRQAIAAANTARAVADEAASRQAGLSPTPPVYAIGMSVNEIGVRNFKNSREDVMSMPDLQALEGTFCKLIAGEDRQDLLVPATSLAALPTGQIIDATHTWELGERGLAGLAARVTPGGAKYLAECPADLRAQNLNHWFQQATSVDTKATEEAGCEVRKAQEVTLRTRRAAGGGEGREIYAVTGPRYASFDCDRVMREAAAAIGHDARGKVMYNGARMTLDAMFHSNIKPEHAVAGEMFKGMIRVRAADDGSGSVNVSLGLYRNLCRNLIIVAFDKVLVGSRKHIGAATIQSDIAELLAVANERIGLVVGKWSEANVEDVLARYNLQDVDQVFKGLVLNGAVRATGVKPADMIQRLHSAWEREPGYTKAAILNAITRSAHEQEWKSWADAEELEETAGELLYQKVWNLDVGKRSAEEVLA